LRYPQIYPQVDPAVPDHRRRAARVRSVVLDTSRQPTYLAAIMVLLRERTRPGLGIDRDHNQQCLPLLMEPSSEVLVSQPKNIKFQLAHLVWQFPDIKEIYPGSINVRLDQSLQITSYDYTTLPTPWWDVDATHPGRWVSEIFSFVEIKFEYPLGGTLRRAWIFDCHNSAYFSDPVRFRYETISTKVEGISYNQRCRLHLP
jgi:hypothetical protein